MQAGFRQTESDEKTQLIFVLRNEQTKFMRKKSRGHFTTAPTLFLIRRCLSRVDILPDF